MNIRPLSILFVAGILTAGCSDAEPPYMTLPAPMAAMEQPIVIPADVAGTWYSRVEKNAVNCGAGETVDAQVFVITQDETDISLLTSTGDLFVGTVNGDIVEWAGDYPERGGTSTMAISADKDAAMGESPMNSEPASAGPFDFVDNVAFFAGSLGGSNSTGTGRDKYDYYAFMPAADATVQVELSHFDTLATNMELLLFDENLDLVSISNNPDGFEIIEAQVEAGTRYYIKVETRSISSEVNYNLSVDIN
jgi:hypothetical protein